MELHKSLDKRFIHTRSQNEGHGRTGGCDFYIRCYFLFKKKKEMVSSESVHS